MPLQHLGSKGLPFGLRQHPLLCGQPEGRGVQVSPSHNGAPCCSALHQRLHSLHLRTSTHFCFPKVLISEDSDRFDMRRVEHSRDMVVVALWYMLREVELSAALVHHLRVQPDHVSLLIPTYKTDSFGKLTERTLRCSCRIRLHPLCPWHAGERRLIRVQTLMEETKVQKRFLFPQPDGSASSKLQVIAAIRTVLPAAGIELQRPDGMGTMKDRFHGHCLRVSGAQMLAAAGVQLQLIQLSVQRYTQDAALILTPDLPSSVLGGIQDTTDTSNLPLSMPSTPTLPRQDPPSAPQSSADLHSEVHSRLDTLDQQHSKDMDNFRDLRVSGEAKSGLCEEDQVMGYGLS